MKVSISSAIDFFFGRGLRFGFSFAATVAAQDASPGSLLGHYRALIQLRTSNAALARAGFELPREALERDWSEPYQPSEAVEAAWAEVYRGVERHWPFYQLAEKLVDIDDAMATWRHKHVVTVERVIGFKRGTGGTPGVPYLQSTLAKRAFPELWSLRTRL